MKNIVIVDIDTDRKDRPVIIGKPPDCPRPKNEEEAKNLILLDMSCLCEAVCTMIHVAEQTNVKPSPDSLRDCIKHLEEGFGEAGYKGLVVPH